MLANVKKDTKRCQEKYDKPLAAKIRGLNICMMSSSEHTVLLLAEK